ncbi:uncharacterized protein METZ01_LOCUS488280 [marine metagenome]|uniref:Orc1-like AAA ATPase domain-containing protein n=1 Tax=marine metagenome TaxID=408172 RepID=A0A383CSX4_9ZZZZ
MSALTSSLDETLAGRGQVALLAGEAGIGKTDTTTARRPLATPPATG